MLQQAAVPPNADGTTGPYEERYDLVYQHIRAGMLRLFGIERGLPAGHAKYVIEKLKPPER